MQQFGPYFSVAPLGPTPAAEWVSLPEFMAPHVLASVVERTHVSLLQREQSAGRPPHRPPQRPMGRPLGRSLGRSPADLRAVASTVSLGLFSRILSPAIGAELVGCTALAPDPTTTFMRPAESGPGDLGSSAEMSSTRAPEEHLDHLVLPLLHRFADDFGVPEQVLRGNLAAAVVGACDVVAGVAPSLRRRATELRARMLAHELLVGTGTETGPFVRTSCCLIHRLPVGFVCGNCPLVANETPTALRLQGRA